MNKIFDFYRENKHQTGFSAQSPEWCPISHLNWAKQSAVKCKADFCLIALAFDPYFWFIRRIAISGNTLMSKCLNQMCSYGIFDYGIYTHTEIHQQSVFDGYVSFYSYSLNKENLIISRDKNLISLYTIHFFINYSMCYNRLNYTVKIILMFIDRLYWVTIKTILTYKNIYDICFVNVCLDVPCTLISTSESIKILILILIDDFFFN